MTRLVINSITSLVENWDIGKGFNELFGSYQKLINAECIGNPHPGSLSCIYVQFQFDATWDKAAKGIRISRYSAKYNDIQAYIEFKSEDVSPKSIAEQKALLGARLVEVLSAIKTKMDSRAKHQIPELITHVEKLNKSFVAIYTY